MTDFKDIRKYSGKQVLISSNRLVFNSSKDSIILTSAQFINLSAAEKVTVDVGPTNSTDENNMFLVNAPKVQFGLNSKGRTVEPIVKGDSLEKTLNDLMSAIEMYSDMVTASVPLISPLLAVASTTLKAKLAIVKSELKAKGNVKSDTSYTI
jgi:hypothetical protein